MSEAIKRAKKHGWKRNTTGYVDGVLYTSMYLRGYTIFLFVDGRIIAANW